MAQIKKLQIDDETIYPVTIPQAVVDPDSNKTIREELDGKVDKITGKQLSTEDYTTAEKSKVTNLPLNTTSELALKFDKANLESARSQSTTKAPTSKLVDDNLNLKVSKIVGTNLVNPKEITTGYYIGSNGNLYSNPSTETTDFIPFKQADVNIISNIFATTGQGLYNALYNADKQFISAFQGNTATWQSNVAFVRFSTSTPPVNKIANVGTSLIPYTPYTDIYKKVVNDSIDDNAITNSKILDNVITENKISDGAISYKKTSFFAVDKNIFNINATDNEIGKYVSSTNGNILINSALNATGWIPVVAGQSYALSYKHQIAWYNSNKVFVAGSSSTDTNKIQVAPVGAAYLRCTVNLANWDLFQVEIGIEVTPFVPYAFKIVDAYLPVPNKDYYKLALTRKLHVLKSTENSLYHKSYVKRWNPFSYALQGIGTNWQFYERYMRVNAATAGNLSIKLFDAASLRQMAQKTVSVLVGDPATNNGAKTVQVIGDSFTYSGYWFDKTNTICPALTFVGIRKSQNVALKAEGRSGWSLNSYMTNVRVASDSFSPFLHPVDPYKYYGNTALWIQVKANSTDYRYAGFTDIANAIGFDSVTGRKSTPNINDVMYVDANSRYEVWDGSAWVAISDTTLNFSFNYGKYISTWGITMPDIVSVLLGTNDFRNTELTDSTFAIWKSQMDILITSVQSAATAAGKTVKIALCLPMTETASNNNTGYINPVFQRANMWDARNRIINAFDNDTYSNAGVDIVDTGTAVDGDYGFAMSTMKPFADYSGTDVEIYSSNVPHPSNQGYYQLGVRLAAYIQIVR